MDDASGANRRRSLIGIAIAGVLLAAAAAIVVPRLFSSGPSGGGFLGGGTPEGGRAPGTVTAWDPATFYRRGDVVEVDGTRFVASADNLNTIPDGGARIGSPQGFGGATTGGEGGETYRVTSLDDSGPGTLREAAESPQPLWIRFEVSGPIQLESPILVASNKTIDGRGARIELRGKGLILAGVENVILENLMLRDGQGSTVDGIQVSDRSTRVWINHIDVAGYKDGQMDITRGATDITVSWSRFTWSANSESNKAMLINGEGEDGKSVLYEPHVTVHHNFFDSMTQRNPRMLHGYVHAYNNYVRDWGSYGMQAAEEGQLLSQANIFDAGQDKNALLTSSREKDRGNGFIRSTGDLLLNGAETKIGEEGPVFDPADFYETPVAQADDGLRERLTAFSGWIETPPADQIWVRQ